MLNIAHSVTPTNRFLQQKRRAKEDRELRDRAERNLAETPTHGLYMSRTPPRSTCCLQGRCIAYEELPQSAHNSTGRIEIIAERAYRDALNETNVHCELTINHDRDKVIAACYTRDEPKTDTLFLDEDSKGVSFIAWLSPPWDQVIREAANAGKISGFSFTHTNYDGWTRRGNVFALEWAWRLPEIAICIDPVMPHYPQTKKFHLGSYARIGAF